MIVKKHEFKLNFNSIHELETFFRVETEFAFYDCKFDQVSEVHPGM